MDWDADGAGAVISNRRSSPDTQELTTGGGCSARHVARCRTWECSTIQCYAESPHGATRLSGKQRRVRTAVWKARQLASASISPFLDIQINGANVITASFRYLQI